MVEKRLGNRDELPVRIFINKNLISKKAA